MAPYWSTPCTCNHSRCLLVSVVNGSCYLVHTLLCGDGAQGRAGVEVVEVEAQEAAAAELIHQQGLALLEHIWVQHGHANRREGKRRQDKTQLEEIRETRHKTRAGVWENEGEKSRTESAGDVDQCPQTLFRGSTVHQVGPVGQDVSRVIPLQGTLLPKLGCGCLVQCRPLPWPLGAQKQGETAATHLCAGIHCFPYSTWREMKAQHKNWPSV